MYAHKTCYEFIFRENCALKKNVIHHEMFYAEKLSNTEKTFYREKTGLDKKNVSSKKLVFTENVL